MEDDEADCADHGRLYRFEDAVRACPARWRVPRLKFGGDTGFNVRYSGWIDPHRADSSRAMGRNAAYWASTPGPPDDHSATVWYRHVAANRNTIWRSR